MENRKYVKKRSLCLKYAAAINASITTVGFGINISWTSPALPHLTNSVSQFPVSIMQGAWIASLNGCGSILGYLLSIPFINWLGPKRTLLLLAIPQIISWILICLGRNWIILCLARVIGGIGYGAGLCATSAYVGQIGDESTRGIFLTLIKLTINIGIFITMFLGAFLSYNTMNLALLGIPIIFIISFSFMPDSNQFQNIAVVENENEGLVGNIVLKEKTVDVLKENTVDVLKENTVDVLKGETVDALEEKTVVVLNDNIVDVLQERTIDFLMEDALLLNETTLNGFNDNKHVTNKNQDLKETIPNGKQNTIAEKKNLLNNKKQNKSQKSILWRLFVLRNNQKALLIILVATLTDIFSGHMAIVSYTQQIFEYSGASLKAEYAALFLGALKIAASLISTLVVEKFGRRVLFFSTGLLAALAHGLVGLFFFLKMYLKVDVSSVTWLPLFGVSMYEIVGSVGFSSLYYIYQGELFSNDVKGVGVTCTNIAYEVIAFVVKFYFQMVIYDIGIYTLFWGFGICSIIGSGLTYWISPETKGKSLEEIQNLLRGSRKI
ncbi:facilitated trehalose transporter Tret1-like [Belonocnema kinseyi]|uniref:facilitated trehalose transporter Tret1-like n=1 Tax=Belonocnema kinseyi TaxID=2817044 RepID=UPI00143D0220|nr:facilitated trehalose transporter Tret1-like [Belonocnema kinseyi]XP_033217924.1 facilitated trehalose transporter Tret1-like [Belonocnema kinseyi]